MCGEMRCMLGLLLRCSMGRLLTKIFSKQGFHTDGKFSPAPDVLTSIIPKTSELKPFYGFLRLDYFTDLPSRQLEKGNLNTNKATNKQQTQTAKTQKCSVI